MDGAMSTPTDKVQLFDNDLRTYSSSPFGVIKLSFSFTLYNWIMLACCFYVLQWYSFFFDGSTRCSRSWIVQYNPPMNVHRNIIYYKLQLFAIPSNKYKKPIRELHPMQLHVNDKCAMPRQYGTSVVAKNGKNAMDQHNIRRTKETLYIYSAFVHALRLQQSLHLSHK